jgi:hypothetical protein
MKFWVKMNKTTAQDVEVESGLKLFKLPKEMKREIFAVDY